MILSAALVWPQPAFSHHSFSALQTPEGEDAIFVLNGTVRIFRILNPHGALIIDAVDEAGNSEGWLLELSPASQLAREGWHEEIVAPGDEVTVSIFPASTPNRARLRALLIPGSVEGEPQQLLVTYGIRGDTPVMRRLKERLPVCGTIDPRFQRTECFPHRCRSVCRPCRGVSGADGLRDPIVPRNMGCQLCALLERGLGHSVMNHGIAPVFMTWSNRCQP